MTFSCARHHSFVCATFVHAPWLIDLCVQVLMADAPSDQRLLLLNSCVWHDSFVHAPWLIDLCVQVLMADAPSEARAFESFHNDMKIAAPKWVCVCHFPYDSSMCIISQTIHECVLFLSQSRQIIRSCHNVFQMIHEIFASASRNTQWFLGKKSWDFLILLWLTILNSLVSMISLCCCCFQKSRKKKTTTKFCSILFFV